MAQKFLHFDGPCPAVVLGASGGIGAAITAALAASGQVTSLTATSRQVSRGDARDTAESAYCGVPIHATTADVTDEQSLAKLAARFTEAPPGIVINACGLLHDGESMRPEKRLEDIDPENIARSFAVNATGALLLAKHFIPLMRAVPHGVFATLSARVGSIGDNRLGGWYAYRAAKAAQNMMTRTVAIEARRRAPGVVVVGLHPGTVNTALSDPFQANVPDGKLFTPEHSAACLLKVIGNLTQADSGHVFAWDGSRIAP